jgi:hypothetical protein
MVATASTGTGEVCREPVSGCCIAQDQLRSIASQNNFRNTTLMMPLILASIFQSSTAAANFKMRLPCFDNVLPQKESSATTGK